MENNQLNSLHKEQHGKESGLFAIKSNPNLDKFNIRAEDIQQGNDKSMNFQMDCSNNAVSFSYFFPPIRLRKDEKKAPEKNITIDELHSMITGDNFKELQVFFSSWRANGKNEKKFKETYLHYFTPHGTYSDHRAKEYLIMPSKILAADFDDIADPKALIKLLINDNIIRPVLAFISPSGKGIKALYKCDPSVIDIKAKSRQLERAFSALNNYFFKTYKQKLCPGQDIARACFLCHDPEAYYNSEESSIIDLHFYLQHIGVSTHTTLHTLDKRHLSKKDNHYPELLNFTSAAYAIGESPETVKEYINSMFRFLKILLITKAT